jgi:ubiquinone/menaquinone biosynthesis C-methylase UbiE
MTSLFDQSTTSFDEVDRADRAKDFPIWLTRMAEDLAALKHRLHDLADAQPGGTALDVGCGTGADVRSLAERVGPSGRVVGIDNSQVLVDEARAQSDGLALPIEYQVGDAHQLPFPDATFDVVRCERVMMHLADPRRALGELVRVTRPGGRILVADPDHGMWALDGSPPGLVRSLLTWWFDIIANPWVARQMPAWCLAAGLVDLDVSVLPIVLRDLGPADAMTGLTKAAGAAADQGVISPAEREAFDRELADRAAHGRFFMCGAIIVSVATRPS